MTAPHRPAAVPHRGPWLARTCLQCEASFSAPAYHAPGRLRSRIWFCPRCTQRVRRGYRAPERLSQLAPQVQGVERATMAGGKKKTTKGLLNYSFQPDDETRELSARRRLEDAARRGVVTALVDLHRQYGVRYPLLEARTGWRPGGGA